MCCAERTRRRNFLSATRRAHGSAEESETDTPQGVPLSLPAFLQLQRGLGAPDSTSTPPPTLDFSLSQSHFHLLFPFLSASTSCHVPVPPSRSLCAPDGDKLTKAPPLGLASEPSHAAGMPGIPRSRLACFHMTPREQRMISIQSLSILFFSPHAAFVTRWLRVLIISIFFFFSLFAAFSPDFPVSKQFAAQATRSFPIECFPMELL